MAPKLLPADRGLLIANVDWQSILGDHKLLK